MPSIDKLRHNIRHAVSLSAFSPNLIHRIRYFFLYTVTFRDYSNVSFLSQKTDILSGLFYGNVLVSPSKLKFLSPAQKHRIKISSP